MFIFLLIFTIIPNTVLADGIRNSKLATGTEKLLNDLEDYLPIIAGSVGAVIVIYLFIRRAGADEMDKKKWTDRIHTAIFSTIGAVVGATIVSVFISYYK